MQKDEDADQLGFAKPDKPKGSVKRGFSKRGPQTTAGGPDDEFSESEDEKEKKREAKMKAKGRQ